MLESDVLGDNLTIDEVKLVSALVFYRVVFFTDLICVLRIFNSRQLLFRRCRLNLLLLLDVVGVRRCA